MAKTNNSLSVCNDMLARVREMQLEMKQASLVSSPVPVRHSQPDVAVKQTVSTVGVSAWDEVVAKFRELKLKSEQNESRARMQPPMPAVLLPLPSSERLVVRKNTSTDAAGSAEPCLTPANLNKVHGNGLTPMFQKMVQNLDRLLVQKKPLRKAVKVENKRQRRLIASQPQALIPRTGNTFRAPSFCSFIVVESYFSKPRVIIIDDEVSFFLPNVHPLTELEEYRAQLRIKLSLPQNIKKGCSEVIGPQLVTDRNYLMLVRREVEESVKISLQDKQKVVERQSRRVCTPSRLGKADGMVTASMLVD